MVVKHSRTAPVTFPALVLTVVAPIFSNNVQMNMQKEVQLLIIDCLWKLNFEKSSGHLV